MTSIAHELSKIGVTPVSITAEITPLPSLKWPGAERLRVTVTADGARFNLKVTDAWGISAIERRNGLTAAGVISVVRGYLP